MQDGVKQARVKRILLDMDGVIVDFYQGVLARYPEQARHLYGVQGPEDMDKLPRGLYDIASILGVGGDEFYETIGDREFWSSLPAYEGAIEFAQTLRAYAPVYVCTVPLPSSAMASAAGKLAWVAKHLGFDTPVYLCHNAGKESFARSDTLLIDDDPRHIKKFEIAGGRTVYVPRPWWHLPGDEEDVRYGGLSFGRVPYDRVLEDVRRELLRDGGMA